MSPSAAVAIAAWGAFVAFLTYRVLRDAMNGTSALMREIERRPLHPVDRPARDPIARTVPELERLWNQVGEWPRRPVR
jgi:hypothetical protein